MVGDFMRKKARSASSVKVRTRSVLTEITNFDKEELNRQIAPKLKQNKLERLAGVRLYQTGKCR
ncbi:hypothetical protein [Holdemanella porci]|uniref:hypothetical protein n=1 Tax=Holdemanella porci TaxID=2652276 RepID=UPI0038910A89